MQIKLLLVNKYTILHSEQYMQNEVEQSTSYATY